MTRIRDGRQARVFQLARLAPLGMPVLPVIRALVTFLSRENGGRATMPSLASGQYLPHLVIQPAQVRAAEVIADEYLGVRFVSAPNELLPNESLDCEMELMYHPNVNYDSVRVGETFTVREGGKVIGFGVVTQRTE